MANPGDDFEGEVFTWLHEKIQSGEFGLTPENAQAVRRPAYWSRDRQKEIVFDNAIELTRSGAAAPFLIWIWECKDYSHPVPVDDVEEFHAKIQQVGSDRTKGTIITTSTFQAGGLNFARANEYEVTLNEEDVLLEMDLPGSWEEYLSSLTSRHRHELRRKFRRFQEAGLTNFQMIENPETVSGALDPFFKFFRESRDDKKVFMTVKMERFFRSSVEAMVKAQLLRLGILELDERPVAFVICLDDGETLYLYNNSFDPKYCNLNLGFVSKAFSVKHGINLGKKMFNFLKGDERYKYHLGGKKVLLYSCKISLL